MIDRTKSRGGIYSCKQSAELSPLASRTQNGAALASFNHILHVNHTKIIKNKLAKNPANTAHSTDQTFVDFTFLNWKLLFQLT